MSLSLRKGSLEPLSDGSFEVELNVSNKEKENSPTKIFINVKITPSSRHTYNFGSLTRAEHITSPTYTHTYVVMHIQIHIYTYKYMCV